MTCSDRKPDVKDLNSGGIMIKFRWAQRDMLVIQDDMLFRRLKNKNADILQTVIPMNRRRNVPQYSHDQKTFGNPKNTEQNKTVLLLARTSKRCMPVHCRLYCLLKAQVSNKN